MNVLLISIDSLRCDHLGAYEESTHLDVDTENLDRFAERASVFENHYAGSLPCMPARREWLTGTQEFLWRPWGSIEPFDQTLPLRSREAGAITQLITDHYHYFQHGSHGYYEDFNGFDFVRGQENDAWKTSPRIPDESFRNQLLNEATDPPHDVGFLNRTQYSRNAATTTDPEEFFAPRVFSRTVDWLDENQDWENWFCYVDSFDVHEPFHIPEPYASMYTDENPRDPELPLWPYYGPTESGQSELSERELAFLRSQFAGSVTMVDRQFGRVLDTLDEHALWDETVVIVTSDHGFLLGEHGWIGKNDPPVYDTIAHTPLLIWHPESPRMGERCSELTSAVDLYATALDAIGAGTTQTRHSRSLMPVLTGQEANHREWAIYGYWGSAVNITDGEYTYLHPARKNSTADCYSTSMMNPNAWFVPPTPKDDAETGTFLPYTDSPVWQYSANGYNQLEKPLLFNVSTDPEQRDNLAPSRPEKVTEMRELLTDALDRLNAPDSQYERLKLKRE